MIRNQHIKGLTNPFLTTGCPTAAPHATTHRFHGPLQHWSLPHTRFTCWWNHQDLNFQMNDWLLLHHWWRTKIYPWPNWFFYWRSHSPPCFPDSHFCNSELHCCHQKPCHHNLFSQYLQIYMAFAPAWTASAASFFHHVTAWECNTFWNHILPTFEQHVDTTQQPDNSRPTTSLSLETISHRLAHWTSKISWPVPFTMPGTTTHSLLLLTKNLFYHGTTWEWRYTWWNHILPYIWTKSWCVILWPL